PIEAGKEVTTLPPDWQQLIQAVISDDGSLKRLKFCVELRVYKEDIHREDFAQRFDAAILRMPGEPPALTKNLR
ncbi:recombination-associated protein RdgC, partial [Escherichia coli]|uniref:recombination-associated protein RdgC n=1 Tax=Escherichia coli TaxID=562 RepID=UPI0013F87A7E